MAAIVGAASRRPRFAALDFAAPALMVSVAYIDPGNFATNIAAGAACGYRLLWVVVIASAIAMLFQSLSSKLGIVTGKSLAEHLRNTLPRSGTIAVWIVSEAGAVATELAEFLGAALAFHLLLGVSMLVAAVLTFGVVTFIVGLKRFGLHPLETVVIALIAVVAVAYVVETVMARPVWSDVLRGSTVPWLGDRSTLTLTVAIIGATVMPHVLYFHSNLTQQRVSSGLWHDIEPALRRSAVGVIVALSVAAAINLAMMYTSASTFHARGVSGVGDITVAYRTLTPMLGRNAALVFAIALLASGLSSAVVGTNAGQSIMQDLTRFSMPLWLRRVITMVPALAVIVAGIDATTTLVVSQVVLSLVLPVPVIALLYFTGRRHIMGRYVNSRLTTALAATGTLTIVAANALLLVDWTLGR